MTPMLTWNTFPCQRDSPKSNNYGEDLPASPRFNKTCVNPLQSRTKCSKVSLEEILNIYLVAVWLWWLPLCRTLCRDAWLAPPQRAAIHRPRLEWPGVSAQYAALLILLPTWALSKMTRLAKWTARDPRHRSTPRS